MPDSGHLVASYYADTNAFVSIKNTLLVKSETPAFMLTITMKTSKGLLKMDGSLYIPVVF